MKRQSKAEEALNRQIKQLEAQEDTLRTTIREYQVQLETHGNIRRQLETHRNNLASARKLASERNKP